MNFNNRTDFDSPSEKDSTISFVEFGKNVFAPFSDGFVLAGYERHGHAKFAIMAGSAKVYEDAFESCREPLSEWRKAQSEIFPDLKNNDVRVSTQNGEGKKMESIDDAVKCFAQVSDSFLFMGYCAGEREIRVYAEDPLMADAVSFLRMIAMGTWLRNKEAGK